MSFVQSGPTATPRATPRWTWQPHTHGQPAEPHSRSWLAAQLGLPEATLPLSRDDRRRPRLDAPLQRYDCSWSHSGDGLLIALAEDARIGVDLERQHARPRSLAVAERYFTPAETAWLAAHPQRDLAFLRLWCAKEAVLKAHGHGIAFGLERLRFEDQADGLRLVECDPRLGEPELWTLQELTPAPGYLGALAWRAWDR